MVIISKTSGTSETRRSADAFAMSGESGRALANVAAAWLTAAAECQREMIGFVSIRLAKDGETVREMAGCKSPADATAIQSRWIEETLRDYSSEVTKLMTICTKAVNDKSPRPNT